VEYQAGVIRGCATAWNGLSRSAAASSRPRRFSTGAGRTIFISDVHLGTRGCKAALPADFLLHNDCKTLYLVGDIVDGWRLKRNWFWSSSHSAVVNAVLRKVEEGTRVVVIPGNHDEVFRDYCGLNLAGVELLPEAIHETADGREMLVIHGDH
jgi:UDP-2,3-diacylglucosamine pyrophosphatase LpxH